MELFKAEALPRTHSSFLATSDSGQAAVHIKITPVSSLFWTYGQMDCWLFPYSLHLLWPTDTKHIFKSTNECNPSLCFYFCFNLSIEQFGGSLEMITMLVPCYLYTFLYFPGSLQCFLYFHLKVTKDPREVIWAVVLCTFDCWERSHVVLTPFGVLLATPSVVLEPESTHSWKLVGHVSAQPSAPILVTASKQPRCENLYPGHGQMLQPRFVYFGAGFVLESQLLNIC